MLIRNFRDAEQKLFDIIQDIKQSPSIRPPYKYRGINDPLGILLDVKIKEQKLYGEYGWYLNTSPDTDKPTIVLDTTSSDEERLNFTFFHEIVHHLIRSDNDIYAFIDEIATKNDDLKSIKERLANIGAAEFLLPGTDVKDVINKNSFSVKLILELDKKYPASKPAIAIQLARQAIHKCFVIVCEYGPIPIKNPNQPELIRQEPVAETNYLYIRYAASSPTNKYSIGSYAIIPKNHILNDIYKNRLPFAKGKDTIPFRSRTDWSIPCEGVFYKGKVYAVFNIESPPPPTSLQPELFKLPN